MDWQDKEPRRLVVRAIEPDDEDVPVDVLWRMVGRDLAEVETAVGPAWLEFLYYGQPQNEPNCDYRLCVLIKTYTGTAPKLSPGAAAYEAVAQMQEEHEDYYFDLRLAMALQPAYGGTWVSYAWITVPLSNTSKREAFPFEALKDAFCEHLKRRGDAELPETGLPAKRLEVVAGMALSRIMGAASMHATLNTTPRTPDSDDPQVVLEAMREDRIERQGFYDSMVRELVPMNRAFLTGYLGGPVNDEQEAIILREMLKARQKTDDRLYLELTSRLCLLT